MLLLLFAGVGETPPEPPEPITQVGAGVMWRQAPAPSMADRARQAAAESAARDMRDVQDFITALFALNRIF